MLGAAPSPSRGSTGEISSLGGVIERVVGGRPEGGEMERLASDRCRFAFRALRGGRNDGDGGAFDMAVDERKLRSG